MPIKVQCGCGAAFAAKDELAGKTVKCPKCQKPLKISAAGKAPAKPKQAIAAKPVAKAVKVKPIAEEKAKVLPVTSTESLFDEIGLQAAVEGTRPCPGCTEPMPIEAIICIKCGYNARIGRRMETAKLGGGSEGDAGHGAVVADLMGRAATVLEEDAAEDKKKTGEGLPWWVYLIGLAALSGFWGRWSFWATSTKLPSRKRRKKAMYGFSERTEATLLPRSRTKLTRFPQFSPRSISTDYTHEAPITFQETRAMLFAKRCALVFAVVSCSLAIVAGAADSPTPGKQVPVATPVKVKSAEGEREAAVRYLLALPADYDKQPDQKWPLVLFLHGIRRTRRRH